MITKISVSVCKLKIAKAGESAAKDVADDAQWQDLLGSVSSHPGQLVELETWVSEVHQDLTHQG